MWGVSLSEEEPEDPPSRGGGAIFPAELKEGLTVFSSSHFLNQYILERLSSSF